MVLFIKVFHRRVLVRIVNNRHFQIQETQTVFFVETTQFLSFNIILLECNLKVFSCFQHNINMVICSFHQCLCIVCTVLIKWYSLFFYEQLNKLDNIFEFRININLYKSSVWNHIFHSSKKKYKLNIIDFKYYNYLLFST